MTAQEAIDVLFNELKCIDRNDGIHCDKKCETCDLVMDVEIIREAYNMAISALQEQELKQELKQEVKNSKKSSLTQNALDTISRQEAIDALDCINGVEEVLRALPSAQPEIIRCKDCKYYREYGYVNGKPKFLPRCTFSSIYVNAVDFCSKAERR